MSLVSGEARCDVNSLGGATWMIRIEKETRSLDSLGNKFVQILDLNKMIKALEFFSGIGAMVQIIQLF